MVYATEADVYAETGLTTEVVQRLTEKLVGEVSTLIEGFVADAEGEVKDLLEIPHVVSFETHLGTGEDDEFQLGPEDEKFHINYDAENLVEKVNNCYFEGRRKKLPYPRDCDTITDDKDLWDATGYLQPADETTIKQAGTNAMKFAFVAGSLKARYPDVSNSLYIDKNIDIFDYLFFRVRSSAAVIVTVRLYNEAGQYNQATYTIVTVNKWYLVMLDLDDDFTSTIDWDDNPLYWLEIEVSGECDLYVDNWNFNDGWCFTAPSGKLVIMRKSTDEPSPDGYEFLATYTYDPFLVSTPKNIKNAVAQIAGAKLFDHLLGVRQAYVAFEAETGIPIPDKESMVITRSVLIAKAKKNLASYGYGWAGTAAQ